MSPVRWIGLPLVLLAVGLAWRGATASACPICGQPTVALSERLARSDTALLVQWVSARMGGDDLPEATTFEVVEIPRDSAGTFRKGDRLELERFHAGKSGNLVLLMGRRLEDGAIKWEEEGPLDVTETSFQYIAQAPPPEVPTARRLEYFVRFLEYPDVTIGNDAFAEFVNAPSADIVAVASRLPREKLRRWLLDENLSAGRQAAFGLMLGLCGKNEDIGLLEQRIFDRSGERRFGIEGLIVGYLLLTGDSGLDEIDQRTLRHADADPGEIYPVQTALRYLWSYGNGRIANDRLKASMRLLLDVPQFAELALIDLARWKDWTLFPRLKQMYDDSRYADVRIHKAIAGFLIAATKDLPPDAKQPPAHVVEATRSLALLREANPRLVKDVELNFYIR